MSVRVWKKLRSCKQKCFKATLLIAILAFGLIGSHFILNQRSNAQMNTNSTEYMSKFMPNLFSLLPSNINFENLTIEIGSPLYASVTVDSAVGAPVAGKPIIAGSAAGVGFLDGMNVSEIGTSWSELRENFSSRDHGQGIIVNDKGEIATYIAEGQETIGKDGKLLSHGIMLFNSSSSGGLARLSNAMG